MLSCPKCAASVLASDLFCEHCGGSLSFEHAKAPEANLPGQQGTPVKGSSPINQLEPGIVLYNRYQIVRRIGGGGMGSVYLAHDRNLADAARAVKEMLEMFADPAQREKAIDDFRRESTLLASLEHPSIPTIYDFFFDSGRYYLVMKFIQGRDLSSQLKHAGGRVDERRVVEWAIQACDVLQYIHTLVPPIIFRDLKPANLMLDEKSNRVMLIDFGIARTVAPAQKGVTAIGTMGYAPPELFSGKVTPRSDIYSLGATMFHLLTGSDPQDNPLLIFDFSKNPRPTQINPSITPEMERILTRATEYRPENRFSSAADMMQVLMEHKQRLAGQAPMPVYSPPLAAPAPSPAAGYVFCGHCGQQIVADDLYCAYCGQRQPLATTTAKLAVVRTGEIQRAWDVMKDEMQIGRTDPNTSIFPEIDLTVYDPETKVSRRHARLMRRGDQFLLEDTGSANGTVVNGQRLAPNQPRPLRDGDRLVLGETELRFSVTM